MKEKLKTYWGKLKALAGRVSKKIWIALVLVVVLLAAGITFFLNTRPYAVLVTGANASELSTVMSWLEGQGIRDYKLEGDTVLVPERLAPSLKVRFLTDTYTQPGNSFSLYFEKMSALSTQSERDTTWLVALMEQMNAVIRQMDGVRDATVTITPGSDLNYILDSNRTVEATASIIVTMNEGRQLTNDQAAAIRAYVSHSVENLSIEDVVIVDNYGNPYNILTDEDTLASASALKLQYEAEYERKIRSQIMQLLTRMYGEDNVAVGVNCVVEVSRSTIDDHDVHLPGYAQDGSTDGRGIIGSELWDNRITRDDGTIVGGVVGTAVNSDLNTYVEDLTQPDGNERDIHTSGQTDYDNSTTDTHTIRTAGYLTDCHVAVSINATTAGAVNIPNLRNHVAQAAGINAYSTETLTAEEYLASKVSIMVEPFYNPTTPPPGPTPTPVIQPWILIAAAIGLVLFLILLIIILIISRKRKKKRLAEAEAAEQAAMEELLASAGIDSEAEPAGADVMELQTERNMELRQDIRKFAEENPEIAAQLLKAWLRGGGDNG